jgi:hypothetical protein
MTKYATFGQSLVRRAGLLAAPVFAAMTIAACGGGGDGDSGAGGGQGGGAVKITVGNSGNSGSSSGGSGSGVGGSTTGACGDLTVNGCVGWSFEAEGLPLDIYVMFDQSGSMLNDVGGMTRLQAVQQATTAFLRDPMSDGIGVGIGYFGVQPIGQVSCDAAAYETPDVPVTLDHERVIASLASRVPTGETPTAAALRGACAYARSYQKSGVGRAIVTLLVTDGKPEAPVSCSNGGCCPTLEDATSVVAECLSERPGIATYVLGVGPNLDNLSRIAEAGGTHAAYLVGNQDVASNVLNALNQIRGDAQIPCDLEIPPPEADQTLDFGQVNVLYADTPCGFKPFHYVASVDQCGDDDWYYDDAAAPKRVKLCPKSCDLVKRPGSSLRFSVGCQSLPPPVR